jgi:hypothetical protein
VPSRRRLASAPRMMWCRERPASFGPVAHRHPHLGGDQHLFAVRAERLAEDLLGEAGRVDVGRVDQVDARVPGDRDLLPRAVHVDLPDRVAQPVPPKPIVPQRQRRDPIGPRNPAAGTPCPPPLQPLLALDRAFDRAGRPNPRQCRVSGHTLAVPAAGFRAGRSAARAPGGALGCLALECAAWSHPPGARPGMPFRRAPSPSADGWPGSCRPAVSDALDAPLATA